MSLNASVMSLSSGLAALLSGSIITQAGEGAPLEHFSTVGYIAASSTVLAIFLAYRLTESAGLLKSES